MTVLVTGGSGLVGSHVIAELRAAGIPVRALVREPARGVVQALGAEAVVGDVTDPRAWARAGEGVDAIVHAAALVAQPVAFERFVDVNVGGTRLAVETAQARGAHLVHISSVAVYGRGAAAGAGHPVDEEFPFQPLAEPDFYARTKRMAEAV
ncbi:MAG TPA: NAD-dependent epimerase/dehydratase family protein, partial [Gemmatimonadales bacterium]|nr:NAD-dependent epimerase/dehydratase family protein [Gemmatimonadales bacterium]